MLSYIFDITIYLRLQTKSNFKTGGHFVRDTPGSVSNGYQYYSILQSLLLLQTFSDK